MSSPLKWTSKEVDGLNVSILGIWKTSSLKRCLYRFLHGMSSFAIRILSPGFKFCFLASLLNCCALCETKFCYIIPRDFIRCQYCYAFDSRNNCVEERLHLVYTAIRPFVLQTFATDNFEKSNIALFKGRFCFKVCRAGANSLDFTELFDISFEHGSFIRPYFQ